MTTDGAAVLDVEITLPWPPHSLSANGSHSWQARYRETQRRGYGETVHYLLREQMFEPSHPYERIAIEPTYCYCGKAPDADNAISWLKLVIDVIKRFGIVADDSPEHVFVLPAEYERVQHRDDRALKVRITSIGAG